MPTIRLLWVGLWALLASTAFIATLSLENCTREAYLMANSGGMPIGRCGNCEMGAYMGMFVRSVVSFGVPALGGLIALLLPSIVLKTAALSSAAVYAVLVSLSTAGRLTAMRVDGVDDLSGLAIARWLLIMLLAIWLMAMLALDLRGQRRTNDL